MPREKQALIGAFFERWPFMRFAAAATVNTHIPDPLALLDVVAPVLVRRILDLFKWTDAPSLVVVFESSQRTNSMIQRHFAGIKIDEHGGDLPIEWCFMPKQANEPALEVADFIMHAVHGLAWDEVEGRNRYARRDFRAIFQRKNPRLSSFILIEDVRPDTSRMSASLNG
jgi:hypothetical protein